MKRFINYFATYFLNIVVGALMSIGMLALIFFNFNVVPATSADYAPLQQQISAISENPSLLFEIDGSVEINSEIITVCLENDKCKILAEYNKKFEILSYSEVDKSYSLFAVIAFSVLSVPYTYFVGFMMTDAIVAYIKLKFSD